MFTGGQHADRIIACVPQPLLAYLCRAQQSQLCSALQSCRGSQPTQLAKLHKPTVLLQSGDTTDKHVLRLWLISAASRLVDIDSSRTWRRIEPLLPSVTRSCEANRSFCLHLIQLVCDIEPAKVRLEVKTSLVWFEVKQKNHCVSVYCDYRLDDLYHIIPGSFVTSSEVR